MGNGRELSPEAKAEYLSLRGFLVAFMEFASSGAIPNDTHSHTVLDEADQRAPMRALAGLRMAVNDCIEMSSHWHAQKVAALDASLRSAGLLTLSAARHQYSKKLASVLKRGKLRGDTEYYLVAGVLADPSTPLSEAERMELERMSSLYASEAP